MKNVSQNETRQDLKILMVEVSSQFYTTFSIRIVADCVALSCQVTRKLKRATTLEFTAASAIILIHCWWQLLVCPIFNLSIVFNPNLDINFLNIWFSTMINNVEL